MSDPMSAEVSPADRERAILVLNETMVKPFEESIVILAAAFAAVRAEARADLGERIRLAIKAGRAIGEAGRELTAFEVTEMGKAMKAAQEMVLGEMQGEIARLQAEVARLREALIAVDKRLRGFWQYQNKYSDEINDAGYVIREALAATKG